MNAVETTVRWEELEDRYEDELKCDAQHTHASNRTCSRTATHYIRTKCVGSFLGCERQANYNLRCIDRGDFCTCDRMAEDCWRVVPI